jgi:hypothetical protein
VSLLIAGARWDPRISSWAVCWPGLVVLSLPSPFIFLDRGGTIRLLTLIASSTICLILGATQRLQAPMLIAAGVLLTLAIDALEPTAAGLPRWIPIGATGLRLLWAGATFERRINNLRHIGRTLSTYH